MYIKPEFLRYHKDIDLNDTFKFDKLPETGKSAGLILKIDSPTYSGKHYNYTLAGDKFRLIDWITKVQVITDGKRPLKDLDGAVAQANEYWNTGRTAIDRLADRTLYGDHCLIPIAWGRKLYDTEYYLDWANYDSIELDVTNIFSTDLFQTATIDIINLKLMDDAGLPPSKGVFMERIWREWTSVADETKYLKLPTGNKLRRILLRAVPDYERTWPFRRSRSFFHLLEEIKLGFNSYAEIAFDGYGTELMEQNALEFPHEAHTGGTLLADVSEDTTIRTGIGMARSKSIAFANVATTQPAYDISFYTYTDDLQSAIITAGASNQYVHWDIWGLGYMNTLALLFDHFGIDEILDTALKAPLNLDVKTEDDSTAADGAMQAILSELVSR